MDTLLPFLSDASAMHLALAAGLGAILGMERDLQGRPAGLRTAMLISAGSALFTIVSKDGFNSDETTDISRVASQIVVGVGFLGAGVLFRNERTISGLTTSANIWYAAAVGMAAGAGLASTAIIATVMALVVLELLRPLSRKLNDWGIKRVRRRGGTAVHEA